MQMNNTITLLYCARHSIMSVPLLLLIPRMFLLCFLSKPYVFLQFSFALFIFCVRERGGTGNYVGNEKN